MKESHHTDSSIEAPEADYLYIAPSQLPDAGNGLFTVVPIYRGEVISIYNGEILTQAEAALRAGKGHDRYFMNMPDGSIMDPMNVSCFAKYANDAAGFPGSGYKNNCKIALDEGDHVCIIATRNIKPGEEIFCSYGKRYWKKHGIV